MRKLALVTFVCGFLAALGGRAGARLPADGTHPEVHRQLQQGRQRRSGGHARSGKRT